MLRQSLFILFLIVYISSSAESEYKFRIQLKDKGQTSFSVSKPEEFLSGRAIERRKKQSIAINETDLPISKNYISAIENLGCVVVAQSKWVETVSVHVTDSSIVEKIQQLPFVKDVTLVWKGGEPRVKKAKKLQLKKLQTSDYGYAEDQIKIHNGQHLHDLGFKGQDMEIAVIDAGFANLREIPMIDNIPIKGIKDFIYQGDDPLAASSSDHGIQVLSCMGTNQQGTYVGTAPKAKYWLLRTEDSRSEYPIEEDYWVTAIEYADSVGVDLVNSSLGYTVFDAPAESHKFEELDGKTVLMSRAAQMATDKGIFVVSSAGNEGNKSWGKISVTADGIDVLTVGAIHNDSTITNFSSIGPTADLRIKPDVVAIGGSAAAVNTEGYVVLNSGTSFSAPIMCGLVACLWQANPSLTNKQILDVVRKSSHMYQNPNEKFGYGIPNMKLAMDLAKSESTFINEDVVTTEQSRFFIKSHYTGQVSIEAKDSFENKYQVSFITADGRTVISDSFTGHKQWNLLSSNRRFYIISIVSGDYHERRKLLF